VSTPVPHLKHKQPEISRDSRKQFVSVICLIDATLLAATHTQIGSLATFSHTVYELWDGKVPRCL